MTADALAELEHVCATVARSTADDRVFAALRALQQPALRGSLAWTEAMLARPSRLARIAEAVARPGMSLYAIADRIEAVAEGYRRDRWRRDYRSIGVPETIDGKPEAEVWRILRQLGSFPANSTIRAELTDWYKRRNPANPKS